MNKIKIFLILTCFSLVVACSDETADLLLSNKNMPITISSTYPVNAVESRATDNGFVENDAVGIFVVDYDSDGQPQELTLSGNRANNVQFTFDGTKWNANYQLYWADSKTPADFYGYYPFDAALESVDDYSFTVCSNQASDRTAAALSGYEQSDLMRAKATKVMPTTETVNLQYKHLMAGITLSLQMGTGFTAAEWAGLEKTVLIENTVLEGKVNIATGSTTVKTLASPEPITPLFYNNAWRAVVFPQTVASGKNLATVTVDGQTYKLTKTAATTYQSGKMHNMTITVNKSTATGQFTFTLTSDDIVAWIDDAEMHEGLTYIYTIVKLDRPGTLKEKIDSIFPDQSLATSLKIVGPLNADDRLWWGENLMRLKNLNLQEAELTDGRLGNLEGHSSLQLVIFPAKSLKYIEDGAFRKTNLVGNVPIIPEGVEYIGWYAFAETPLYGSLTLPSTLKELRDCVWGTHVGGELHLPEGLERVEAPSADFTGSLYFPSSLKEIKGNWGYSKMTGTISIPRIVTKIGNLMFCGTGCSQVEFHDGIVLIGSGAFRDAQLSGELVLPPNLKKIEVDAFARTKISKVIFPDALRIIDNGAFVSCTYLTGTVRYANNVARVPQSCFADCTAMTGIILPKNVELIETDAFKNCYSLNTIVCENPEPPVVRGDAFLGVPKDNFTVEVPKGSVSKYREAPGWKEFKRIAEYSNFVCRPMQANALNTAHSEQLVLNADGNWQLERKPSWVTLSKTSGSGKTELTLTFQQLPRGAGNRQDSIIFTMPGENYRTFCVVSQYDYDYDEDSYITLQNHSKGDGIDIVFVGDGYDGEDISNGNYLSLVRQQVEYFFGIEPYKSHREYFNVYAAFALSQEKGVNTMNSYVNNHFGTLYGYDGKLCTNNQLLAELDQVEDYAVEHTPVTRSKLPQTVIILVPNCDAYPGVTYYANAPVAICPPSNRPYPQDTRGTVQHEAGGHAFGRLGDEAIVYNVFAPRNVKSHIENMKQQGWYDNLSTVSGLHNVSWADFIFDERYSDEVDVFEGGFNYMRGIFRPESNSCMNYGIPYYNAPSRLGIMRRIMQYAHQSFSMDYFYSHDSKQWGDADTRASFNHGSSYAASNQHRAPMQVKSRNIGNRVRDIRNKLKNKTK